MMENGADASEEGRKEVQKGRETLTGVAVVEHDGGAAARVFNRRDDLSGA
jgi:hypothetical protein